MLKQYETCLKLYHHDVMYFWSETLDEPEIRKKDYTSLSIVASRGRQNKGIACSDVTLEYIMTCLFYSAYLATQIGRQMSMILVRIVNARVCF